MCVSMKKNNIVFIIILLFVLLIPSIGLANMAAPKEADVGSSITFEQNDTISVISEVLDITVKGSKADILATYRMKNTSNESVSTQSMFLSPNIDNSGVTVRAKDKNLSFLVESYALNYETQIEKKDWQYAVLSNDDIGSIYEKKTVDTISFQMDFGPKEEYDVIVSYTYSLGGYPDYDFNVKVGKIEYYLLPANMWKGFENLTINLYLDNDMPIVKKSNLNFKKLSKQTYQYVSDTLPKEDLFITIDENWFQNIFSTFRSPYLLMTLLMFSPFILIILVILFLIIFFVRRRKKKRIV